MSQKFLWFSDIHLNRISLFELFDFIKRINEQNPTAIILTGDISSGFYIKSHLYILSKFIKCKIYFVLGNHEIYFSSFASKYGQIHSMCKKHDNLIWLSEEGIIKLNESTAIIGSEGFYTCEIGYKDFVKYTYDWFLISDFRDCNSWDDRFLKFKEVALVHTNYILRNLKRALKIYDTVYIATHFPPFFHEDLKENYFERMFWEPYNFNLNLGNELREIMDQYPNKNLVVLSGHIHQVVDKKVSPNIRFLVSAGNDHNINPYNELSI